jgi:hypothetical protein
MASACFPAGSVSFPIENIMERRIFLKFGSGAAIGAALAGCGSGSGHGGHTPPPPPPPPPVRGKLTVGWNNVAINAVRATRVAPPIAARSMAILHSAIYNAWSAYDPVALPTIDSLLLRRPVAEHTHAHIAAAISYAAYAALVDQFPAQQSAFDAYMAQLGYLPSQASTDLSLPQGVGTVAARRTLAYAHTDGANQLGNLTPSGLPFADYSGYVPANPPMTIFQSTPRSAIPSPGLWQPLRFRDAGGVVRTQVFLTPYWGQVRPFALSSGGAFRPGPPAAFGSSAFLAQARAMVATQIALTPVHKIIVEYWAGGARGDLPTTLWSQFAQFVSERDRLDERADIKLFFALSNALSDASIAAFDAKRHYNCARPITAIRYLLSGQRIEGYGSGPAAGLQAIAGEAWLPWQPLSAPGPGHPDYVSGHSTLSAAAAAVLKAWTGSDVFNHHADIAARSMLFDPSLPATDTLLGWESFNYAACEAGFSRVYGGIHFSEADLKGRTLGERVGNTVFERARRYWLGHA